MFLLIKTKLRSLIVIVTVHSILRKGGKVVHLLSEVSVILLKSAISPNHTLTNTAHIHSSVEVLLNNGII